MENCGTKLIKTKRLVLRKFTKDDAFFVYKNWASDNEVTKYLKWPTHSSIDVTEKLIHQWVKNYENKNFYKWAITLKENINEPIGDISVNELNEITSTAIIGYVLSKSYWNQGIMTEALKAVINFLFNEVKVKKIDATHDVNNVNSGKVMQKSGMKYIKTIYKASKNNQGVCDVCYYSIKKEDIK